MLRLLGRALLGVPGVLNRFLRQLGGAARLARDSVLMAPAAMLGRKGRLGRRSLADQMVRVGVRSVPVVMLVSVFIGVILALQTAPELRRFGAEVEAARICALGILRELGPLIGSLILAGYAGAAIAAELGTMRVGEEIDALEAGAVDPVRFLVVPRVWATVVMVTSLTVMADWMGLFGSWVTAVAVLGLDGSEFIARVIQGVQPADILSGLIKSVVFGAIIALTACHEGLAVAPSAGAEGVGRATTRTVVRAGVCIILADTLLTAAFYILGFL